MGAQGVCGFGVGVWEYRSFCAFGVKKQRVSVFFGVGYVGTGGFCALGVECGRTGSFCGYVGVGAQGVSVVLVWGCGSTGVSVTLVWSVGEQEVSVVLMWTCGEQEFLCKGCLGKNAEEFPEKFAQMSQNPHFTTTTKNIGPTVFIQ